MSFQDFIKKRNVRPLYAVLSAFLALLFFAAVFYAVFLLRRKTDMICSDTWELKTPVCTENIYAQYQIRRAAFTDGNLYLYYYVDFGSPQNLSAWQEQSEELSPALKCQGTVYTMQYAIPLFDDVTEEGYCVFPQVAFPDAGNRLDLELTLGGVSIPFSMVPTPNPEKDYFYAAADEGGFIAVSWMEGKELLMDIYPFSNTGKDFFNHQRLSSLNDGNILPFYLLTPDGSRNRGTILFVSNHFSRWNFGETEPGEYFLCTDYLTFGSERSDTSAQFTVNLTENTTDFETYAFPGGVVSITGIESLDLPPGAEFEGTVIEDGSDYWLLTFHLEPDNPGLVPLLYLDLAFYSDTYSEEFPVFGQLISVGEQGVLDRRYVLCLPREPYDLNVARTQLTFQANTYYPLIWWHNFEIPITVK